MHAPAAVWPSLREELSLHAAAPGVDGAPAWSLQDPVRNRFFRIDWLSFEILHRWHLADAEKIAAAIHSETPLDAQTSDVEAVIGFLDENELLQAQGSAHTEKLLARHRAAQQGPWSWLLHHYLFFRIPLLRPDRWLERALPWVAPLGSRGFFRATMLALAVGLWLLARNASDFAATLVDTLSWRGLASYGVTLVLVKLCHELGHAFTAKRLGCRVPTMGVAFLVMWPMAYTDVNETWKLTRRRDRLAVGAAGMLVELYIAAWATLAWSLLPPGTLREMCFVLVTTTWISTLVINISPIMRFDGYFLLSDWLDIPNLHARAFALARWQLREWLFALGAEPPEHFDRTRRRSLIAFAWAVWLYRLVVFFGIALLVYHYFFKALGIFLFIVEIAWFIALPIWRELRAWKTLWPALHRRRPALIAFGATTALLLVFAVPWHGHITAQGLLRPRHQAIYAPAAAQLAAQPYANGQTVLHDAPLLQLHSPDAEQRAALAGIKVERARWQLATSGLDEQTRPRQGVLREELEIAEAELTAARTELARYEPRAPFAGMLVDLHPDLRVGQWVARNERLATLVDPSHWQAEVYLEEDDVERIKVGDLARFYPETAGASIVALRVTDIDRDATRTLPDAALARSHGGEIAVRERRGQLVPDRALYRVTLQASEAQAAANQSLRGHVVIEGQAHSIAGQVLRAAAATLVRESSW